MMLWTEEDGLLQPGRIGLVGPGLESAERATMPFGVIILVKGDFEEAYEAYRELRSKVYDIKPQGLSVHIRPERSQIWCRVSKTAMDGGFSLATYGSLLIGQLASLPAVSTVEVVFVTGSKKDIEALRPVSEKAQAIIGALIKMYDEMNFDCETCEYVEVCDEVVELKAIRERLKESG
jgi:CO dehydrogenase/acetyl-CoA synthase beta subunit